jgi:hypothetical protein
VALACRLSPQFKSILFAFISSRAGAFVWLVGFNSFARPALL